MTTADRRAEPRSAFARENAWRRCACAAVARGRGPEVGFARENAARGALGPPVLSGDDGSYAEVGREAIASLARGDLRHARRGRARIPQEKVRMGDAPSPPRTSGRRRPGRPRGRLPRRVSPRRFARETRDALSGAIILVATRACRRGNRGPPAARPIGARPCARSTGGTRTPRPPIGARRPAAGLGPASRRPAPRARHRSSARPFRARNGPPRRRPHLALLRAIPRARRRAGRGARRRSGGA